MSALLRHAASIAGAGLITAWILFRAPAPSFGAGAEGAEAPAPLRFEMVEELLELAQAEESAEQPAPEPPQPAPKSEPLAEPQPEVEPQPDPEPEPPAPEEAGSRLGSDDGTSSAAEAPEVEEAERTADESAPEAEAVEGPRRSTPAELKAQPELVRLAHAELSGDAKVGFSTVLHSEPKDQLDIARVFGEEIVLVPKSALDPGTARPSYWRIDPASLRRGSPRVQAVEGRPPLERYRRHRSFLSYDYGTLPEPLRDLRKRVIRRDDIYIFSALIPPSEWAVVIGRRREALAALGVAEEEVEQFVLVYFRSGDGFDVAVDRVVTADGRTLVAPPAR